MKEIDTITPDRLSEKERSQMMLFVCDGNSIKCTTFREIQKTVSEADAGTVLVVPDSQYERGTSGWAKIQILSSVSDKIETVMPLDYETVTRELKENWGLLRVEGQVAWNNSKTILKQETQPEDLKIGETSDPFDIEMMERAEEVIKKSNCWLDPAGCVIVRDGEELVESCSTSFNKSRCTEIPIDFEDLELNPGERMLFCDSLHAERVGITKAAENGIEIAGSTMYVTKFPCRPCSMEIVSAGIEGVVFEKGSYGLSDANLLVDNGVDLKRVIH